jgi:glycosyltransferase involved in cell wall biosynthesis
MWRDVSIAVVVPAFNEAKHIAVTLRSIPRYVDRIVVVDDGSSDETAAEVLRVHDARIDLVQHAANRGVGQALCTGYAKAFAEGAEIVAVMAGDGQMDPEDLQGLLGPVVDGDADYVKGDRLSHPECWRRMPRARLFGNHVLSLGTRVATGLAVRDSQCGYTALHRRAAERVPWAKLWRGYGYPNDLLGLLSQTGARVRDIVVRPVYADEKSGIGWRHALLVIPFVLATVALRRVISAWQRWTDRIRSAVGLPCSSQLLALGELGEPHVPPGES